MECRKKRRSGRVICEQSEGELPEMRQKGSHALSSVGYCKWPYRGVECFTLHITSLGW